MTKDETLAALLGITEHGFGLDGLPNVAFTVLALIEVLDVDVNKLAAAKQRLVDRMTKHRVMMQDQRSKQGIADAQAMAKTLRGFQDRKPEPQPAA
jgi:hypothetical protein